LDPLDPLTEIIKSGQAFSTGIMLERILWVIIGFLFIGAILTSIVRGIKQNYWSKNKAFLSSLKATRSEDNVPTKLSEDDN